MIAAVVKCEVLNKVTYELLALSHMEIDRIKRKVKSQFLSFYIKGKNYTINNAIIITSEPRSGSTWLMELLGNLPNCIVNWEPLHENDGVVPKSLRLGSRVLLSSNDDSKKFKKLFEDILTLKVFNAWTGRYISFNKISTSKYVVTKFVRANNLLPWFTKNLNLKHKPILLLRHPITTSISQLKNFHRETGASLSQPYSEQKTFVPPDCINNERYVKHQHYINSLSTPLERQIALWCVNNVDLIAHPDRKDWITVYYEDLLLKPEKGISLLLKELELPFTQKDYEHIDFKKASQSNNRKEYNPDPAIQLESFLKDLDNDYLNKIQRIFDHFKFKNYTASSAYPIKM